MSYFAQLPLKGACLFLLLFVPVKLHADEDLSRRSEWKDESGLIIAAPTLDLGVVKLPPFNKNYAYFSKTRLVNFINSGTAFIGVELNCSGLLGEWVAPKGKSFVDAVGYLWVPKTQLSCTPDSFLAAPGQDTVVKMELEGVYPNIYHGYYDILGKAEVLVNGIARKTLDLKGRVVLVDPK